MQLDDTEGKETLTILHKGGASLSINQDGSVLVANQKKAFLFMNAKEGETTLADEHGCFLTLKEAGAVVSSKSGTVVEVKDGMVQILAKDAVVLNAQDVQLKCGTITIGDSSSAQPAVLGTDLMAVFMAHTHPTGVGPSGPPIPIPPNVLGPTMPGVSKGLSNSVKVAP